ncbi:MAG: lytic transglycosylase domain-containing protein, partial [Oscillospiraceae bacterium]|nr:lytic transglycosylase domain-containing protein [Oscillospiraceae bacterium]
AINHYYPMSYSDIIFENAREFDLEPELIFAVIHAESRFRANARSPVGASGLMQIMEDTANWIAPMAGIDDFNYSEQIMDPEINIRLGSFYLRMMLNRFEDLTVALSAYNAGSGNVGNWLNNPEYSSDGVTLDYIPFAETRNYIEKVERNMDIYRTLLNITSIFR